MSSQCNDFADTQPIDSVRPGSPIFVFPRILFLFLVVLLVPSGLRCQEDIPLEQKIAGLAQTFGGRLGIKQRIMVTIAPANTHLVSVESVKKGQGVYRVEFDGAFLRSLNERDLSAAVAHEIGHIWIFTHFPYLQTESLANRQALKLVPRSDLERVYRKVWKWKGKNGNLAEVMEPGDEADTAHDSK